MTKELARYFFMLINKDLQFSFNGMGLPSDSCEWLENQLIQGNYDKVEEFIKKRYDEHAHASKKKRKFRAMICNEFCDSYILPCITCPIHFACPENMNEPYKTKYGKYIFIEVRE